MRRRLPPLKALPAFEIAAAQLSFSAAAAELHLTHGAISRQMKALEDDLGIRLFRRLNRRIELTEAGSALVPAVRQALDALESSAGEIRARPQQGPLTVSCLATFMMRWLIPNLYSFNARHSEIDVRLSASHAPIDFARDGIDVAIRLGKPPWPRHLAAHAFLQDQAGPVCAPALLRQRPLLRPADLRHHTLLHTQTRPDAWTDWFRAAGAKGVEGASTQHFEHTYFLLEAAASGLGVGIGSYPLVRHELESGRLVAPLGFAASDRAYHLLYAKQTAGVAKIKAFLSWVHEAARENGASIRPRSR